MNEFLNWLRNITWTPMNVLKVAGLIVVATIIFLFAFKLISATFRPFTRMGIQNMVAPMLDGTAYQEDSAYYSKKGSSGAPGAVSAQELSFRNVAGSIARPSMAAPMPSTASGNTAEEFEVSEYNASIEARDKDKACAEVAALKEYTYVIFEGAENHDSSCVYSFKVERDHADEVLSIIKGLDPKDLWESTYTIKGQIDDFTSEEEVLTKKRTSIDDTLTLAMGAYDDITALATRTQNADALAGIINSKIAIIERLTQERININEQIDRLARAKEDQLDSINYTHFRVDVRESKYIDTETVTESWKEAFRSFVYNTNKILQDGTLGLVVLLFWIAQYAILVLVLLLVVKYGWRIGKKIWQA